MSQPDHIKRFTLERLLADDLPDTELRAVTEHLEGCTPCTELRAAVEAERAAFQEAVPYGAFRIEHEQRKDAQATAPRGWLNGWAVALLATGAGAAVLVMSTGPSPTEPTERIKGDDVQLSFEVLDAGTLRPGAPGMTLAAGAVLQLVYEAGDHPYVGLVGIDGAGQVDVYYPDSGDSLGALPAGSQGRFPFSLTLDATAGQERFFAVFSHEAAQLAEVRRAAEAVASSPTLRALSLPAGYGQASTWIEKE